jgi:fermentation-respiration switch protein FrsA (DUF1100 family)
MTNLQGMHWGLNTVLEQIRHTVTSEKMGFEQVVFQRARTCPCSADTWVWVKPQYCGDIMNPAILSILSPQAGPACIAASLFFLKKESSSAVSQMLDPNYFFAPFSRSFR